MTWGLWALLIGGFAALAWCLIDEHFHNNRKR